VCACVRFSHVRVGKQENEQENMNENKSLIKKEHE
jgi:hypothetical protein